MRYLSLFSGIEAASVAWKPLGWKCVGVSEISKFPCAVLAYHYPDVPNLGDITKITEDDIRSLGPIDIIVGGFPCQDVSLAGKRKGLRDTDGKSTRSGLFFDAMRIVRYARRYCELRYLLFENVPGLFSSHKGQDFAEVVGEMAGCRFGVPRNGWRSSGCATGPDGLVEWCTLDAQFFGLAQRRKRVFALADFGDWASRPPILLERESLRGNPPPRREKRQVAPPIPSRSSADGGLGTDFDLDGGLIASTGDISYCLNAGGMGRQDYETETLIAHSLRAEGFDASEDGTGRGTPIVPVAFSSKDYGADACDDFAPTLRSMSHSASHANGGGQMAVAFAPHGRKSGAQPEIHGDGETVGAIRSDAGGSSRDYVATYVVRRLTTKECEILMGFPPGYTDVPIRGKRAADGPRYKALGNSFAVPVVRWIGERIQSVQDSDDDKMES